MDDADNTTTDNDSAANEFALKLSHDRNNIVYPFFINARTHAQFSGRPSMDFSIAVKRDLTNVSVSLNQGGANTPCLEADITPEGQFEVLAIDGENRTLLFTGTPEAALDRLKAEITAVRDRAIRDAPLFDELRKFKADDLGWLKKMGLE